MNTASINSLREPGNNIISDYDAMQNPMFPPIRRPKQAITPLHTRSQNEKIIGT